MFCIGLLCSVLLSGFFKDIWVRTHLNVCGSNEAWGGSWRDALTEAQLFVSFAEAVPDQRQVFPVCHRVFAEVDVSHHLLTFSSVEIFLPPECQYNKVFKRNPSLKNIST